MAHQNDPSGAAAKLRGLIQTVPLFTSFPNDLIDDLQKAATIAKFNPEDVILRQGEHNDNLYFLLLGNVDVLVDGGLVATLRRKGDLLGEMSVITERPCSATIVAKTPVELICINVKHFRQVLGHNEAQFNHILYRIYSKILADKVVLTNQRAKMVESVLDELQKAKNEIQDVNAQMERRVVERTQTIQSKLHELLRDHIEPLKNSLHDAAKRADAQLKPAISKSLEGLDDLVQLVQPLVQRFNMEISMRTKAVLLAQSEKKAQTVARIALGGTGMAIDVLPSADRAEEFLKNKKYDVIMIDGDSLSLVEVIQQIQPRARMVFIGNQSIRTYLPDLISLKVLPNIVFVREDDRVDSIRTIMTSVTKLCSPNIFGLEKYLNFGVDVREITVRRSDERSELIADMLDRFSRLGIRRSILDSMATVTEELLMNAIYDAPHDQSGTPLYNMLQRTTPVLLKPHEYSRMRYATDGTLVGVSVADPFGALPASTIMNYLDSCYGDRAGSMQINKGGAGRGLHMIVENSHFVVFNVQPNRQTEALAFFNVIPEEGEHHPILQYFVQS